MARVYYPGVNRVEIIDDTGRAFTSRYITRGVEVHIQDDGATLKVFVATDVPTGRP